MSVAEIENLLSKYRKWLKDKTVLRDLNGDWFEITTPYLDRHNDALQIYIRKSENGYLLTDDGYIIHDLVASGCPLDSPTRRDLLQTTLSGFGVTLSGDTLEVNATAENFPLRKHSLLQAMLAVNDLFYLAKPYTASLFYEDVVTWLERQKIRYIERVNFTGASGYAQHFDFAIPKSSHEPERILKAITRPTRDAALHLINAWNDTRSARRPDSRAIAILNDESPLSPAVPEALRAYAIQPVLWTQREAIVDQLAH